MEKRGPIKTASLTFLTFPAYPKYAPSLPDAKKRENKVNEKALGEVKSYLAQLRGLITTYDWMAINISCAIEDGVLMSVLTLANQIIKPTYKDQSVRTPFFL